MIDVDIITRWLTEDGLQPSFDVHARSWQVTFNFDGHPKLAVLLCPPDDDEYLIAASEIETPELTGKPLETLSSFALQALVRMTSAEGVLAKVTYVVEESPSYFATSACSVDGPTGKKLRRRLEACARLATMIEGALSGPANR